MDEKDEMEEEIRKLIGRKKMEVKEVIEIRDKEKMERMKEMKGRKIIVEILVSVGEKRIMDNSVIGNEEKKIKKEREE